MGATQLYPAVPDDSRRPDLEARIAELERVVATLATLRESRAVEQRTQHRVDQLDPVALTAALHPNGRSTARPSKRHTSQRGVLAMRVVLFDPTRR